MSVSSRTKRPFPSPPTASSAIPSPIPSAALLERLGMLQRRWLLALPKQLASLRALIADASWELAREDAHRLRGTAGTHGMAAIGERLGELETALVEALARGADPARLAGALDAIDAAHAAASRELGIDQ